MRKRLWLKIGVPLAAPLLALFALIMAVVLIVATTSNTNDPDQNGQPGYQGPGGAATVSQTGRVFAVDYSVSRPDPQALRDAGVKVVARYLWNGPKGVTASEIAALHALGMGVLFVYENWPDNPLGGAAAGAQDSRAAIAIAERLGVPRGTPIYYAVDFDVSRGQMATVLAYLAAADDTRYPARAYGGVQVIDAYGKPGWQTYAWSYGVVSKNTVFYQWRNGQRLGGGVVDFNYVLDVANVGVWEPDGGVDWGTGGGGRDGWVLPKQANMPWPVSRYYGRLMHPIYHVVTMHYGDDLGGPCGAAIFAANSGVVTFAAYNGGAGWTIMIDHGGGVVTRYFHMPPGGFRVRVGERVAAGQQIGVVGTSGGSIGCHLHFEVRLSGVNVDPDRFMCAHGVKMTTGPHAAC